FVRTKSTKNARLRRATSSYKVDCLLVNLFIVSVNLLVAVIVYRIIRRNLLKKRKSPPQARVSLVRFFARAKK
ncbi:MAG: hypothetical protein FWG44_01015, partial [Oscillospiraceae bacterium]|nr:hypothetical protein [Oscillospiraceae bacterium]